MNYLIISILIFIIIIIIYYKNNTYSFVAINNKNKFKEHNKIKYFEKKLANWYSYGENDYFKLDHGVNYYSFFERLGLMKMIIIKKDNHIVGTGCGVLRIIPQKYDLLNKENFRYVWYICDLKIDKKHRGNLLSFKMLKKCLKYKKYSSKCYGISMDNNNKNKINTINNINKINNIKTKNPILKMAQKIPFLKFKSGGKLLIYSLDYNDMKRILPLLVKHRGSINFVSLKGKKDLLLKSTKKPVNLLHLQWGFQNNINTDDIIYFNPIKNYQHMFCCPKNDPLVKELFIYNIRTDVSATIIHYNMDNFDWKFVLTSEI